MSENKIIGKEFSLLDVLAVYGTNDRYFRFNGKLYEIINSCNLGSVNKIIEVDDLNKAISIECLDENSDSYIGATFSSQLIDSDGEIAIEFNTYEVVGNVYNLNVITDVDRDNEVVYINGDKKQKYVIEMPFVDKDGCAIYLQHMFGRWSFAGSLQFASQYSMYEIESNPELAPLKQFAVKVEER